MRSLVRLNPVRLAVAATVLATGPLLSACSSASMDSLDPTEWFDTKKKLSGDRKDVFPDGVPGVTTGVPAELVKGYREPEGGRLDPAKAAAEAAADSARSAPQRTATAAAQKPKKPRRDPASNPDVAIPSRAAPAQPQPAATTAWPAPQQRNTAVTPASDPQPAATTSWPAPQQR